MKWQSLERVWRSAGRGNNVKVRFNDWTHQIKYFTILGESSDGKRFIGTLDSGEKMSFSKKSRGWCLYEEQDEYREAHAV
jgi:hypothetical protein